MVDSTNDDAEEYNVDGAMYLDSSDLELRLFWLISLQMMGQNLNFQHQMILEVWILSGTIY